MGESRAIIITFMIDEDLGFVFESAKGATMDDAIAIALIMVDLS